MTRTLFSGGINFFSDKAVLHDPYPYLTALRDESPLRREKHHDVVMVTGYDEGVSIYNDSKRFSSCMSVTGPFPGFPVSLQGNESEDITGQVIPVNGGRRT